MFLLKVPAFLIAAVGFYALLEKSGPLDPELMWFSGLCAGFLMWSRK
jgi:hypothetical protein